MPNIRAYLKFIVFCSQLNRVPKELAKNTWIADIAVATLTSILVVYRRIGRINTPPPIPRSPDRIPSNNPILKNFKYSKAICLINYLLNFSNKLLLCPLGYFGEFISFFLLITFQFRAPWQKLSLSVKNPILKKVGNN